MDNDSNKIIKDQLNSLPLDVRESISRVPWKDKIKYIAKREGLDEEKSIALETETMFILFGFLSFETYTENIMREVGLDQETASRISDSVYNEIILEIQKQFEMIEAISQKQKEPPEVEPPVPSKLPEQKTETPLIQKTTAVEIPPTNLPMIEPGEVVHDTKPQVATPVVKTEPAIPPQPTIKPSTPTPPKPVNSHYPNGQDPYREPLI